MWGAFFWIVIVPLLFAYVYTMLIAVLTWGSALHVDIEFATPDRPSQPSPLTDQYSPNYELRSSIRMLENQVMGPETVAFHPTTSEIFTFTADGYVVKMGQDGTLTSWAFVGGRPLGGTFDAGGDNLYVADAVKGLMLVQNIPGSADGWSCVLTSKVSQASAIDPGSPITYANSIALSQSHQRVYFTDSTAIWPERKPDGLYDVVRAAKLSFLQGGATGRLLFYDTNSRETHVLQDGLHFPDGIALSENEDFLVVAEGFGFRLMRYWLVGERAGQLETFVDNLPGVPGGVSRGTGGTFWVAVPTPPTSTAVAMMPHARWRQLVAWLPDSFHPGPLDYGMVIQVTPEGAVRRCLQDPTGTQVKMLTSVVESHGRLYMGSVSENYIAVFNL